MEETGSRREVQQAKEKATGAKPNPILDISAGQTSVENRQEMTGMERLDELGSLERS